MGELLREIRSTARNLLRAPSFSAAVVLVLAVGIGASIAVFALVDAVLFRPLPVKDAERLVRVFATNLDPRRLAVTLDDISNSSYPVYTDYRDGAKSFTGIAAYSDYIPVHFAKGDDTVERISAGLVSGNFFEILGLKPAAGRLLRADDDRTPGGHPVVVLSDRFWERSFARDPNVVGSEVRINGKPFTVVGVGPEGFSSLGLDSQTDAWLPMAMAREAAPDWGGDIAERRMSWLDIVGRLAPSSTMASAQAELNTIAGHRAALQDEENKDPFPLLMTAAEAAVDPYGTERSRRLAWLLAGAVGLLAMIAAADAAGLLQVRTERRAREMAIRLALGASRARLARGLLLESIVLAVGGTLAGLLIASWMLALLRSSASADFPIPLDAASALSDPRLILFAAGAALLTGLLFGAVPALWTRGGASLTPALKNEVAAVALGRRRLPLGEIFSAVQVALAGILLTGAGLLARTLARESAIDPGFPTHGALIASYDLSRQGIPPERQQAMHAQILEAVKASPGISSAALARTVPVQRGGMRISFKIPGRTPASPDELLRADFNPVSPGFFAAMGVPIVAGRDFDASDNWDSAVAVMIVDEAFAKAYFPGRVPVGEHVQGGAFVNKKDDPVRIVGVARSIHYRTLREDPTPTIYVPLAQTGMASVAILARSATGDPAALSPALAAAVRRVEPGLPLYRVRTLSEHVAVATAQGRVLAGLVAVFAAAALALAVAGIFGMVAYRTQGRRREFGIRMALGALPRHVVRLVLSKGFAAAGAGLLLGLALAWAAAPQAAAFLFGVTPRDPLVFVAVALVLLAAYLAASALPARRAARTDPAVVLRSE